MRHLNSIFNKALLLLLLLVACDKEYDDHKIIIETTPVTDITSNSVVCGGVISDDGGLFIDLSGVVWSKHPNTTKSYSDGFAKNYSEKYTFTCEVTDLEPNTTYYIRAFATHEIGTFYGEEITFTTESVD